MKTLTLCRRTAKEILRDPLNLAFGIGFPLVLLVLLNLIQRNVPVSLFEIDHLAPAMTVFGLAFMTLFSATLISKDRTTALLMRLYTTPLRPAHYVLGYLLPMLPIALAQVLLTMLFSLVLGMTFTVGILWVVLVSVPTAMIFVGLGLLCGSVFTDKQVGGICGALLTNLTAWLSGIWFNLDLVGGAFRTVAELLPFYHAVEMARAAFRCDAAGILPHLWWVLGYATVITALAIWAFLRQMKRQ